MKRRTAIVLLLLLLFFADRGRAQEAIVAPMDIPLLLSGNFGELRSNHFHSGIDFKTQGREGIAVKAVKAGYISRINVSPYGYGRALYIDHPDGTTSVYGHLSRFAPEIESAVRDSQYTKETFPLTLYYKREIPVAQGEIIAYSGNSGSSGGPHLHFEIRNTYSENPIDPLRFYRDKITDTTPPELRSIRLFPQAGKGIVNGSTENRTVALTPDKAGKRLPAEALYAWGEIGLGIKAYDRMNNTSNIYGVKEIVLKVDGEVIFQSIMNEFSFAETRYLNSFTDWEERRNNNSFHIKSFIDPGNRLSIYQIPKSGIFHISEERPYLCEYILKDFHGNSSRLAFEITGKRSEIPQNVEPAGTVLFRWNRDNSLLEKGVRLEIPRGNLYTDIGLEVDTLPRIRPYAPLYRIGKPIPLHSPCTLELDIPDDSCPDKSRYGIISVSGKKTSWLGGKYREGKITGKIRELGTFSVATDTLPPVIAPKNPGKWGETRRLSFRITDNLSGIAGWRGTLDGRFVLFEYDAKSNTLFCNFDPQRMQRGKSRLKLTVQDSAGNQSEFVRDINW